MVCQNFSYVSVAPPMCNPVKLSAYVIDVNYNFYCQLYETNYKMLGQHVLLFEILQHFVLMFLVTSEMLFNYLTYNQRALKNIFCV